VLDALGHVFPAGEIGLWRGRDREGIEDRLIEPLAVEREGGFVDRFQIIGGDHVIGADVAEEGDLLALLLRDRMFGAADEHIGRDADGAQLLHAVLGGFCLQFARGGEIGDQREVHEQALPARLFLAELADRLEEGERLDIAHRAADLAEHEIHLILADADEVLDFVGNMRDHLDRLAEVIAAPLLFEPQRL